MRQSIEKKLLSLYIVRSRSSRLLLVLSFQIHHNQQLSIWQPSSILLQFGGLHKALQFNLLSITHGNPTLPKKSFHRVLAASQWNSKWSFGSPLFLHVHLQSITMTFMWKKKVFLIILPAYCNVLRIHKRSLICCRILEQTYLVQEASNWL